MWVIVGRTSAISKIFFNNAFVNANFEYLSKGQDQKMRAKVTPNDNDTIETEETPRKNTDS